MSTSAQTLDTRQLRANADAAGQLLKALANPDRLLLLCQIVGWVRRPFAARIAGTLPRGVVTHHWQHEAA